MNVFTSFRLTAGLICHIILHAYLFQLLHQIKSMHFFRDCYWLQAKSLLVYFACSITCFIKTQWKENMQNLHLTVYFIALYLFVSIYLICFLFHTPNFTVLLLSIFCSCFIHTDLYNILLLKSLLVLCLLTVFLIKREIQKTLI